MSSEDMTQHITVYSTTWCSDCKRTKQWFDEHKIAYKEINIEKNGKAVAYVQKINGGMQSVPTIVFPDGTFLVEPTNNELAEKVQHYV